MTDNPTLREAVQDFHAWFTTQSHTVRAWLSSLGDIHVDTLVAVIGIGLAGVCGVVLLIWLVRLDVRTKRYQALGSPWRRALGLAQADLDDEVTRRQQKMNPYYKHQSTWFAATPAEREAWTQDSERRSL